MSYVESHLLDGERIVYRAELHWIVFLPAIVTAVAGGVLAAVLAAGNVEWWWAPGALLLLLAGCFAVGPWIRRTTSEFAVTDKRVLVKLGLVQRDSLETLLSKVEAIGVDQDVLGRLLDYGTITVIGTGGTRESFAKIARPLEFRRQVQAQIVALEANRGLVAPAPTPVALPEARDERDCPWCAERILARARVCKHCGREVTPLAVRSEG